MALLYFLAALVAIVLSAMLVNLVTGTKAVYLEALVLAPGPKVQILAENQLADGFDASPVVVGGDLYLRGRRFLYALARSGMGAP
jgi:hypothetical protein